MGRRAHRHGKGNTNVITKSELLALIRRFHMGDNYTVIDAEHVELTGNVTMAQFEQLGEVLAQPETPPDPPLDAAAIEAIAGNLRQYSEMGVIDYYLPTIPEGEEFVVGLKGQILKLDQDNVVAFLAGCTAVAEFSARRLGMKI
jgi:hypothetical protein